MSIIVILLFCVFALLFCASLVACIRPSALNVKTRKEAAQAGAVCFVVLLVLTPFLPSSDTPTEQPRPNSIVQERPSLPVCETITDRIKRLQCEHQRAVQAWQTSFSRLAIEHHRYLETACPPCKEIMKACTDEWYARNTENKLRSAGPPLAEFNRCMDRAWPKPTWPRHTDLPMPKIPPELSAHYRDVARQHRDGRQAQDQYLTPEMQDHLRRDRPIQRPPSTDPSWRNSDTAKLCHSFNTGVLDCSGSDTSECRPGNVALSIAESTLRVRPYGMYMGTEDFIRLAHWMTQNCPS